LLHAGLVALGVTWLLQSARFHVEAGKTSTEISLIIEPSSVPAPVPPTFHLSRPPPAIPSAPQPTPILQPLQPAIAVKPAAVLTPSSPSVIASALVLSARTPAALKSSHVHEVSDAAKGAVKAEPDELHNEPPEYPEESRFAGEQGVVILRVQVTAFGDPVKVSILKSSGFFRLDQAARRAVGRWRFHPGIMAGLSVSSEVEVPVYFKLQ